MATKKERVDVEELVKHALGNQAKGGDDIPPTIDDIASDYPTLHAFLTCDKLDGKARVLPTITLWAEQGTGCKCVLNDRQAKVKLFARSDSVDGLFQELEAALTSNSVDWRGDNGSPKKRRS